MKSVARQLLAVRAFITCCSDLVIHVPEFTASVLVRYSNATWTPSEAYSHSPAATAHGCHDLACRLHSAFLPPAFLLAPPSVPNSNELFHAAADKTYRAHAGALSPSTRRAPSVLSYGSMPSASISRLVSTFGRIVHN